MKKRFLLVFFLITVLLVSGCGSKEGSQSSYPDNKVAEETKEETEEKTSDNNDEKTNEEDKDGSEKDSAVASSDEMVEVEDVVEDWMVPIHASDLKDGTYPISVGSSSSMFKIESGELIVKDGELTAKMIMGGKGYRYLYMGTGEEAVDADESEYIHYEENADGAHVYTVPVPALDEGVNCTAFSNKKEKWYDRVLVFRSDSLPLEAFNDSLVNTPEKLALADGEYETEVTLGGGTGRVTVESPCIIKVEGDKCTATIIWNSENYDYMIVDGEKYLPINEDGNSTFEIPVKVFDRAMAVIGDTVAMSEPHEIEYVLIFKSPLVE